MKAEILFDSAIDARNCNSWLREIYVFKNLLIKSKYGKIFINRQFTIKYTFSNISLIYVDFSSYTDNIWTNLDSWDNNAIDKTLL